MLPSIDHLKTSVRSVRALIADPDDLPQVFTLLEALSGETLPRMEQRLGGSDGGRRILAERPNIVPILEDRDTLRRLPEGSLGRAYVAFLESENITAAGIKNADATGRPNLPPTLLYLHHRMRDTHDLWHTVTGYKGDVLGETALLAFTLAQTPNAGIGLLVTVGLFKTSGRPDAKNLIVDGFLRGRRAAWLPEQRWETMLAMPLAEVRAKLGVGAPPAYVPLRTTEIRAMRAAA
jgi:ubiquinone biosynthesis protein COQ4